MSSYEEIDFEVLLYKIIFTTLLGNRRWTRLGKNLANIKIKAVFNFKYMGYFLNNEVIPQCKNILSQVELLYSNFLPQCHYNLLKVTC